MDVPLFKKCIIWFNEQRFEGGQKKKGERVGADGFVMQKAMWKVKFRPAIG